ncbi:hypothetical protein TNCV_398521 [Trichonephila clavipes]|nr:hypothetical protein TNCV_398521 [Trichonephila clavipes]
MALYRSPLTVTLWPSSLLKKYEPMIPPAHKAPQTRNALKGKERKKSPGSRQLYRNEKHTRSRLEGCFESELHKLRLETGSIRSNVRLESCAEDPKKTSSNFAISIKREWTIAVVHVKEDQEVVNAVIAASAQIPMVGANEVEGKSFDNGRTIQITLIESPQLVRNPAMLRESSKGRRIINSTDSKSFCGQEVVTDQHPETYTQSLSNVPNENLVALEINASNVQTNGQKV